jgi:hypothetical protein
LLVTTFLTLFLNVFSLQGKEASKLAGNWFQLLMVLFMKEYLPTCVDLPTSVELLFTNYVAFNTASGWAKLYERFYREA